VARRSADWKVGLARDLHDPAFAREFLHAVSDEDVDLPSALAEVVRATDDPRVSTRTPRPKLLHQFLIVLSGTNPLVWRRIQVPWRYSFWDLHVAIQDAMGWLDYHLHEFRLLDAKEQNVVSIGIPTDDDQPDRPVLAGWDVSVTKFFDRRGWHAPPVTYAYDFGDDWQHVLAYEGFEEAEAGRKYPRCVAGEGRCPPEDCGGVSGYSNLLEILVDPEHEEYESTLEWVGGQFDPAEFDPAAVKFDDPKKRWKKAFETQE